MTPVYAHALKPVSPGILLLGAVEGVARGGRKEKANAKTKVCYGQQDTTSPEFEQSYMFHSHLLSKGQSPHLVQTAHGAHFTRYRCLVSLFAKADRSCIPPLRSCTRPTRCAPASSARRILAALHSWMRPSGNTAPTDPRHSQGSLIASLFTYFSLALVSVRVINETSASCAPSELLLKGHFLPYQFDCITPFPGSSLGSFTTCPIHAISYHFQGLSFITSSCHPSLSTV